MLETKYRTTYQKILVDPVGRYCPCSPTTITLSACIIGLLVPFVLVFGHPIIASILLLFSGYLDTLDGTVARQTDKQSDHGSVLDILSDRIVECAVVIGLFAVDPTRAWLIIFMLASMLLCITSFLVVGIFSENETHKSFDYSPGIMERAEAFAFFIAMMIWPSAFNWLAITFIFLLFLTTAIRAYEFLNSSVLH